MNKQTKLIIGCVADDFTGASDAASFMRNAGLTTVLCNGIPNEKVAQAIQSQAIVIALKTRTEPVQEAVEASVQAFDWLRSRGAKHLFFKYCSTFDSTKEGNIGPVTDAVLERYHEKTTILCPAVPVNKRTVVDGLLYVNGVPLHESSMKDHPLTPMWEADLAKLMKPQGKYPSFKITHDLYDLNDEEILRKVKAFTNSHEHSYLIPDYATEEDGQRIAKLFSDLYFMTGGSGILEPLSKLYSQEEGTDERDAEKEGAKGRAILLSGSCSAATLGQIADYKEKGGISYQIFPLALLEGRQTIDEIWQFMLEHPDRDVLVYSSDEEQNVKQAQRAGKERVAALLENTLAELAKRAFAAGMRRIIVAGGETSGAVTKALGWDAFLIGDSIAPGVPILTPADNQQIRLVLKSGNFGQRDFFTRASEMTAEHE